MIGLQNFRRLLGEFWHETDGQDLIEYSLLLSFIALAALSILRGLGPTLTTIFSVIASTLSKAAASAS